MEKVEILIHRMRLMEMKLKRDGESDELLIELSELYHAINQISVYLPENFKNIGMKGRTGRARQLKSNKRSMGNPTLSTRYEPD